MKKILIERRKTELKEPSPEQARGWLNQRVGKFHKAQLVEKIEDLKDNWANGDYTGDSVEETVQKNSEAIGKAQAYADVILTLEEMTEDEQSSEDDEDQEPAY